MWELLTLPLALHPPGVFGLTGRHSRAYRFDRVGSGTEFMCRNVCDQRGLSRSVGSMASRPAQFSCGTIGVTPRFTGLRHRNFATRPCTSLVNSLTRALVRRASRLEEMYDMLRARCGPQGEELMIRICKRPAAADGNETGIADFGKDHGFIFLSAIAQRLALLALTDQ